MSEMYPDGWKKFTEGQNESTTIDELLMAIVPYIQHTTGASDVSILRPRKMRFKRSDGLIVHTNGNQLTDVLVVEATSSAQNEIIGQRIPFGYGVTGLAAEQQLTQIVDEVSRDPRFVKCDGRPKKGAEIATPLYYHKTGDKLLGILEAQAPRPFTEEAVNNLELMGSFLGSKLYGISKVEKDSMTGLLTQSAFNEYYAFLEIQYALRNDYNLSFALMDIDYFKLVNDTLGHLAGNELLTQLGAQLKQHARESDILCRIGGDEFLIAMPETDRDEARVSMLRLVEKIQDNMLYEDSRLLAALGKKDRTPISVSYGIGSFYYAEKLLCESTDGAPIPHNQETFNTIYNLMFKEADAGLYRMKAVNKAGR